MWVGRVSIVSIVLTISKVLKVLQGPKVRNEGFNSSSCFENFNSFKSFKRYGKRMGRVSVDSIVLKASTVLKISNRSGRR